MLNLILVAAGGAIGAALRHLVNTGARSLGASFPWPTFLINVAGSFAMGVFAGVLARRFGGSDAVRLFAANGVLGGFTTFSAFSLDFVALWERGAVAAAMTYAMGSVAAAILALFAGLWLARSLG